MAFALLGVVALLPQMAGAIHGAGSSALASFQLPSLQAGMSKEQIDQVVRDAIMEGLRAQAVETSTHAASKSDDIEVCVCPARVGEFARWECDHRGSGDMILPHF